ncbi:uncharacterized protein [Palaemon carinicauda]|uniref:uncharacterized protein n=1 Tax=Palaemon carinicauda TaxID=392227 RepID=UPI0035B644BF
MSNSQESTRGITHVVGPGGQNVIIVPPQAITKKETEESTCCFSMLICMPILAFIFYVFGFSFAIIETSIGYSIFVHIQRYTIIAAHLFIGLGTSSTLLSLVAWRYTKTAKQSRIRSLMHRYDPETQPPMTREI